MKMILETDLEQDIWIETQKRKNGFKQKKQVVLKLIREAMLAEQEFEEQRSGELQEEFKN